MRAFKTLDKIRKRHTYPQGFPGWLSLVSVEEIEGIIGMDASNKLLVKFREEELGPTGATQKNVEKIVRAIAVTSMSAAFS